MFRSQLPHSLEVNLCTSIRHIQQEFLCERTILDVLQDLLHSLLGIFCDDLRASDIVAVFSSVGDGVTHTSKTALINQVNDQLHFVNAFKVSVSRVITSFAQGFKTSLHQSTNTAAENSLFTEQVGFSFCPECSFQNTSSCTADCQTISQSQIHSLASCILFNSNQARSTLASLIFRTNGVTRCLRSDHGNINVSRRLDAAEVNVEAVSEHQHIARLEVRFDILLIHSSLLFIVDQDHDDVCLLCSFCGCKYFKALLFSLCPGLAAFIQTNDDSCLVTERFLCIQGMCMTLAAVADDCNGLAIQ